MELERSANSNPFLRKTAFKSLIRRDLKDMNKFEAELIVTELVETGKPREAAYVAFETGNFDRAIQISIDSNYFDEAIKVASLHDEKKLTEILRKASRYYLDSGLTSEAADCLVKIGDLKKAIELFVLSKQYGVAVDIAFKNDMKEEAIKIAIEASLFYEKHKIPSSAATFAYKAGDIERAKTLFKNAGRYREFINLILQSDIAAMKTDSIRSIAIEGIEHYVGQKDFVVAIELALLIKDEKLAKEIAEKGIAYRIFKKEYSKAALISLKVGDSTRAVDICMESNYKNDTIRALEIACEIEDVKMAKEILKKMFQHLNTTSATFTVFNTGRDGNYKHVERVALLLLKKGDVEDAIALFGEYSYHKEAMSLALEMNLPQIAEEIRKRLNEESNMNYF